MTRKYFETYKGAKKYAKKHPSSKYMSEQHGSSSSGVRKIRGGGKKPWFVETTRRAPKR